MPRGWCLAASAAPCLLAALAPLAAVACARAFPPVRQGQATSLQPTRLLSDLPVQVFHTTGPLIRLKHSIPRGPVCGVIRALRGRNVVCSVSRHRQSPPPPPRLRPRRTQPARNNRNNRPNLPLSPLFFHSLVRAARTIALRQCCLRRLHRRANSARPLSCKPGWWWWQLHAGSAPARWWVVVAADRKSVV